MKKILAVIMCFVLSLGMIPINSLTLEAFALDDPSALPDADYIVLGQSTMEFFLKEGFTTLGYKQSLTIWNYSNETVAIKGISFSNNDYSFSASEMTIPEDDKISISVAPHETNIPKNHNIGDEFESVMTIVFKDEEGNQTKKTLNITGHYEPGSDYEEAVRIKEGDTDLTVNRMDFGTLPRNYTEEDIEVRTVEISVDSSEYGCPVNVYRPDSGLFKIGELKKGEESYNYTTRLSKDEKVSFAVQPVTGLVAGEHYEEVLEIEFSDHLDKNPITKNITLSFDVAQEGNETHNISVNNDGNGSALANNQTSLTARAGSTVQLVAVPNDGYVFSKWEIEGVSDDDLHKLIPCEKSRVSSLFLRDSDIVVKAVFEKIPAGKSKIDASAVLGEGFAHGSVWAEPPYASKGDDVTIFSVPDDGYRLVKHEVNYFGFPKTIIRDTVNFAFDHSDGGSGYEIDLPLYEVATFERIQSSVTVQSNGFGFVQTVYIGCRKGNNEADPYYINGGFKVTPFSGYEFDRWEV